jgi:hypothetical protein
MTDLAPRTQAIRAATDPSLSPSLGTGSNPEPE